MPHAACRPRHAQEGASSIVERGPNLGDQVYAYLRDRIVTGRYPPGHVIIESDLAHELSVSRTPVSNALIMLKERGLVEGRQGRLAVSRLTIKEVLDLYHCRLAFDSLATRLAAERVVEADLRMLESDLRAWNDAEAEHDDQALWVADLGFHARIYALSGNAHLVRFAETAADLLAVYRHRTIRTMRLRQSDAAPRRRADVFAEHDAILAALVSRDPDAAERSARHHVEHVIDHLHTVDVVDFDDANRGEGSIDAPTQEPRSTRATQSRA